MQIFLSYCNFNNTSEWISTHSSKAASIYLLPGTTFFFFLVWRSQKSFVVLGNKNHGIRWENATPFFLVATSCASPILLSCLVTRKDKDKKMPSTFSQFSAFCTRDNMTEKSANFLVVSSCCLRNYFDISTFRVFEE